MFEALSPWHEWDTMSAYTNWRTGLFQASHLNSNCQAPKATYNVLAGLEYWTLLPPCRQLNPQHLHRGDNHLRLAAWASDWPYRDTPTRQSVSAILPGVFDEMLRWWKIVINASNAPHPKAHRCKSQQQTDLDLFLADIQMEKLSLRLDFN